ncbi:DUF6093 family protein [Streptomyces sp. t39]|uniref:DUF6093 family protein n=1 Tax=Streptomyces sp. t39 TaxID=1828156 RepID=UPI0011CE123B|nr:DUF6093 family protein [Streptomyces sp. t39]TXS39687.1 hypothetical protein EAO77_36075 [Streptomyces sp. t39]
MAGLDAALAGAVAFIAGNILIDTVRVTLPTSGEPVLNEDTGQLEYPAAGQVLYEGPGAVLSTNALGELPGVPDAQQPWAGATRSRYRLYTPLAAPIPPKDAIVTVVGVHDPGRTSLMGRSWICNDPGRVSTVEVVRITSLDQNRVPEAGP